MGFRRSTARVLLIFTGSVYGVGAFAQQADDRQWLKVFTANDMAVLYVRKADLGAAQLGKDVWIKTVNADGSWALNRLKFDCPRNMSDMRQWLSYNKAGDLTSSYDVPDSEHHWSGIAPGTSGETLAKFACLVVPKKH